VATDLQDLAAATLPAARPGTVVPTYDRARAAPGIVHVGVGGFHRAHQAVYLDRLLALGQGDGWGVCGVGVLAGDRRMRDVLQAQDHLYTVAVRHPDGTLSPRVVGSITDYLFAPDDPDAVVRRMAAPSTRVVSLTVTEGGYALEPAPDGEPTTFGLLTRALQLRRAAGRPAFTVMSCDNVEDNGGTARAALTAHARAVDPGLATWIEDTVCFPSSMVDRITPTTTDDDRLDVERSTGLRDAWPVVCEPFTQWVLEDRFGDGRPALEEVGVQLVDDVRPYEQMKLRVLNAGHQVLGHLGRLVGHRWVHEAAQDPLLIGVLETYMEQEAIPSFAAPDGVDLRDYGRTVRDRFASPMIRDSLERICTDTSDRIPKFLLPVVRDRLATGDDVRCGALVVAAWARGAEGVDDDGRPIEVADPRRDRLTAAAARQREDPTAFLRVTEVFGDLAEHGRFVDAYVDALSGMHADGTRRTVERVLARSG
jgi:mannitol 2-dehydrogenase